MDIEEEPFLDHGDSQESSQEKHVNLRQKLLSIVESDGLKYAYSLNTVAIVNAIMIVVSIYGYYATWQRGMAIGRYCPEIPYSPATSSLRWEQQPYDYHGYNPFGGELGTEALNIAWEELKIDEVIRVTKEELEGVHAYHGNSLELENGGYMGVMRVFHDIQCLDWMKREWKVERPEMMDHLDHCLMALRDGSTCRPDLTVGSLYWGHERQMRPDASRSCVNWESLEDWLKPRRLKIDNGVKEKPVTSDGRLVDVALNDNLHTIKLRGQEN